VEGGAVAGCRGSRGAGDANGGAEIRDVVKERPRRARAGGKVVQMMLVDTLIYVLILVLVFGVVWYIITLIPLPHPFALIAQLILGLILVLLLISLLLGGLPLRPLSLR
jgi:hypothetical protein